MRTMRHAQPFAHKCVPAAHTPPATACFFLLIRSYSSPVPRLCARFCVFRLLSLEFRHFLALSLSTLAFEVLVLLVRVVKG